MKLAGRIDWDRLRTLQRRGSAGDRDPLRDRAVAAQHIYGLSDEGVCERRVYDHYFQCFPDEEFFQHQFPHERSDLSHWRKRLGSKLELLLAESLRMAHEAGALRNPRSLTGDAGYCRNTGTPALHPFRWHRDDAIEHRKIKRGDLVVMISSGLGWNQAAARFV